MNITDFIGQEPLSNILINRLKFDHLRAGFLALLLGFVDLLIGAFLLGFNHSMDGIIGVFDVQNVPYLISYLITAPGMIALYVWLPVASVHLFNEIEARNVFGEAEEEYLKFIKDLSAKIASRWFMVVALMLAIGMTIVTVKTTFEYSQVPWFIFARWHFWFIWLPGNFITLYAFSYSLLWGVMVVIAIDTIFRKFELSIEPYHVDNAGGLRFIGDFALKLSRLSLIMGAFIIGEILLALSIGKGILNQINVISELISLPIITLIIFFAPIIACRRSMNNAKKQELGRICKEIQDKRKQMYSNNDFSEETIGQLVALINVQSILRRDFPLMPFDRAIMQAFGLGFLISFVPTLLSVAIDIFGIFR
jgi:hypothetical protein